MRNFITEAHDLVTDTWLAMICPKCGHPQVHIEGAHVSARPIEDGPITEIRATNDGGVQVSLPGQEGPSWAGPVGTFGEGRRQRVSLLGECEAGCRFAVVFTQHKGDTVVEVVDVLHRLPG